MSLPKDIKDIILKNGKNLSEKETAKLREYVEEYMSKVAVLGVEYGLTYQPQLSVTANGIVPVLNVVPFEQKEDEEDTPVLKEDEGDTDKELELESDEE